MKNWGNANARIDDRLGLGLLLGGLALSCASYSSVQPAVTTLVYLALGLGLAYVPGIGGQSERKALWLVFAAGTFWAGIAAIFANQLADVGQNHSDPALFFDLAVNWDSPNNVYVANGISESTGAIVLWNRAYDIFGALGLLPGRYIGIGFNTLLVALASLITIKAARAAFGRDLAALRLVGWLFAACPIFWLFSALFLREAVILTFIVGLSWLWIRLLAHFTLINAATLIVASILAFFNFAYLRGEFVIVPAAMGLAGGFALLVAPAGGRAALRRLVGITICVAAVSTNLFVLGDTVASLGNANASYAELAQADILAAEEFVDGGLDVLGQSKPGQARVYRSLGMALVVSQPLYVRAVVAPVYLWLAPIPVWVGFQLESAYFLLKSLHAIFAYLLVSGMLVAGWGLGRDHRRIEPVHIYLVLCILGFSLSVATTSLEGRHLGVFLPLPLLLVGSVDWQQRGNRIMFRNTALAVLSAMALVHLSWFLVKVVL